MPPLLDERFWQDIRQGLTDAGNRGIVGGTLGGPVDLAAGVINAALMGGGYLGNKLGLLTADQMPQPIEHPVGGSEWLGQKMQDAGMVSENRNPVAETLMGLLGPSAISKGGQAVWAMEQNAAKPSLLNAATRDQLGAIVYHGSPHKFDRFDMSKVGTGEGAQAYGHGLYFADQPAVAADYRKNLTRSSQGRMLVDGEPVKGYDAWAAAALLSAKGDGDAVLKAIPRIAADPTMEAWQLRAEAVKRLAGKDIKHDPAGALYKVDLPDEHIARMLDWDKPLKDQPSAVKAVANSIFGPQIKTREIGPDLVDVHLYENGGGSIGVFPKSKVADVKANPADYIPLTGQAFHRQMTQQPHMLPKGHFKIGGDEQAVVSSWLRSLGIPGIRYFDGVSRAKGEGSYNYVVFDDQLPTIVGKE